jgi:DNA-binding NarL/FixJ family response regulator
LYVPEPETGTAPGPEPEQEKRRLFQAFANLLTGLSQQSPVLAVFEDLHWADDASLEFLLYFARLVPSQRLLLLLTYRSDEVGPALRHLLTGLDRERLTSEVALPRLSLREVDRMLRVMLGSSRAARPELLHAVHELTDGNPFFIEEVIHSMAGDEEESWDQATRLSARIPRSVEEAVQRRESQLGGDAKRVLRIAAVAGRRFDFNLLFQVSELDEPGLLAAIKELISAQLVVEQSYDQFAFRHALTRQAVYSALLQRERHTLHRQMATTLAGLYEYSLEDHSEDLAYHAFEAQDWEAATRYSVMAGKRASRLYSPASAVEHFSRAIEASKKMGSPVGANVYRGRGKASETLGNFDAALADYEIALTSARSEGDRKAEWEAVLDLGMLWAGRDYERAGAYFEHAAVLAQEIADPATMAHSLNRVGNWLVNIERPLEGVARHEQALAIFTDIGDRQGIAGTEDLLGMATLLTGDLSTSSAHYVRAIALFEELNDRQGLASALATKPICSSPYHADALLPTETLTMAIADEWRAERVASEIGWPSGEAYAYWNLALCLGPVGDYGSAIRCADQALAIATGIDHLQWLTVSHLAKGHVYHDIFDMDTARLHFEKAIQLAHLTGSMFWIRLTAAGMAPFLTASGDLDGAERLLSPLIGEPPVQTLAQRQCYAASVELALARGEWGESLNRLAVLESSPFNKGLLPRLARSRALALAGLDRYVEAEGLLQQAAEACFEQGRRSLLWRLHCDLAGLRLAVGDPAGARPHTERAVSLIDELASTMDETSLRDTYRSQAMSLVPGPRPRRTGATAGSLSHREAEVAGLVARGLSNRAIAEELVLSERTVESHVANALSKLGFSSRTQLAAWAVQHPLQSAN